MVESSARNLLWGSEKCHARIGFNDTVALSYFIILTYTSFIFLTNCPSLQAEQKY